MTPLPIHRHRWFSRFFNPFRPRRRVPLAAGRRARFRPRVEPLEDRWVPATTITINGAVTLDESPLFQNSGVAAGSEDNNDSDVPLTTLQNSADPDAAAFYHRLFDSVANGGLGLSTTFATNNGVAQSASNCIEVSGGTVASLGFVDGAGNALPVYTPGVTDPLTGVTTSRSAVNGGAIHLFADATLGNRMVLGVDTQSNVVFAI